MRRREPRNPPLAGAQLGERRDDELELAHALALGEDFGQRARRPAAAGQLAVERSEAARHCARGAGGNTAAPYRLTIEDFLQGGHVYCIFIQYSGRCKRGEPLVPA